MHTIFIWSVLLGMRADMYYVCRCWLQVEAQIEAVSRTVDQATKALPNLTREQQTLQVRAGHCALPLCVLRPQCTTASYMLSV